MNNERLMQILLAPRISEKATEVGKDGQYVFRVLNTANKTEIAQAVRLMFNVDVTAVKICNVKGKTRRFGGREGQRKSWKKAYVTVKEGQAINFGGA